MVFTLIVVLVLSVLSVIFALQNTTAISAAFFSLKMHGPLAVFVLASIGIGILIGVLIMVPNAIKNAFTVSSHRKHIDGLEKSLTEQQAQLTEPKSTPPEPITPAMPAPEEASQPKE